MIETKITARSGLAGLIVVALILAGCSGPGTVGNTPGDSSSPPTTAPLALQGSPPTQVTAGTRYSFQPTVSPSTAGVTFSITHKPAWASFNAGTGALSGTPTVGNEGRTASIQITASDGSHTASLGPFAINVEAPGGSAPPTGSATLTWLAPTVNTDGSILNNLAGYRIYYGTSADDLSQEIDVSGATSTSYVVDGLYPGTYYFAVTAYSSTGTESNDSNVASKTI
jgi:Putative Ig domain/Fibronectin type III domain